MKMPEENTSPVLTDELKFKIRNLVDIYYDIQELRIAIGNRICASFRTEDSKSDKEGDKIISALKSEYTRITDVYAAMFNSTGKITKAISATDNLKFIKDQISYKLVKRYVDLLDTEKDCVADIARVVKTHPMYEIFFEGARGCGPITAAVCIAYFDIHKARHVSSFWSYVGVGVRVNSEGEYVAMSRRALIDQEYVDAEGKTKTRKSLGYNSRLHDYFLGVFVSNCLRARDGVYCEAYYDYKNRYQNRSDLKNASAERIHLMASRQCVKVFLRDLWCSWRSYEGYTLSKPYEVEYLGNAPHKYNEAHTRMALC